jgi:DNA-binding MarR family transcriptional regulator
MTRRQVAQVARDATSRATYKCSTLPEGEQNVLFAIVNLDRQGEANINGKSVAHTTGYNRGHVSRLLKKLQEKELITCIPQGSQKIYRVTMRGLMTWSIMNGGSPVDATSHQQVARDATHATFTPHDIYFKGVVLSVKKIPEHWETYTMKGRLDHITREYEATVQFMTSQKSFQQWVQIYVPAFPVTDLKTANLEAYKRAHEVVKKLQKDYGIKVGPLEMVHAHIATDLFTPYISPKVSKVTSASGHFQIDQSPGYPEAENLTKYGEEEWTRIFNVLFDPVAAQDFDPIALLQHIKFSQLQIKANEALFSENEKRLGRNIDKHLELVTSLAKAGKVLEKVSQVLTQYIEEEQRKRNKEGILKKIKRSGQKIIDDFTSKEADHETKIE